jgi:DNA-binding NtrC family response regulator
MTLLRRKLLVVDDDAFFADIVRDLLTSDQLQVSSAGTAAEALRLCQEQSFDVVILDQKLPDGTGPDLCPGLLEANERTKIIFVTAYPNFENAMVAIRAGAFDYLSKPCDPDHIRLSVGRCLETIRLERTEAVRNYKAGIEATGIHLIGEDHGLAEVARLTRLASSSDSSVLLTGETGTGKSLIARAIHYGSARRTAELISVNCGALPESLIESELFGYEKGAFTGASVSREGLFEMAEGGTVLLDEIGEMPAPLQTRLLNVLEEKVVRRIGGRSARAVDFRLLAATNTDVNLALRERRLREDLYYRINVLRIHIPPLRDRPDDIPALAVHFLTSILGAEMAHSLSETETARLKSYSWPGNLRELRNVLERACLIQKGTTLRPSLLLGSLPAGGEGGGAARVTEPILLESGELSLESVERQAIERTLSRTEGNLTKAAKLLGISPSTLRRKLPPGFSRSK